MLKRILISLLFLAPLAHATQFCMTMSKKAFIENVVKKSDVIALAKIQDFSTLPTGTIDNIYTTIEVETKFLDKTNLKSNTLTIANWQANAEPLFAYKKGDRLLFWLKHTDKTYTLTDADWSTCVPSLWDVQTNPKTNEVTFAPKFSEGIKDGSYVQYTVSELKNLIAGK